MSEQQIQQGPSKKIKVNKQDQQQDKQWIVIKKKTTPLTITVSDHSKVNKFYSHKSIQRYIRYLLTETCVNPMWLAIRRQSQIQHIYYLDIEIEDYLFEKMLQQKQSSQQQKQSSQLPWLGQKITIENKAVFKQQRLNRYVWQSLLIYDEQVIKANEQLQKKLTHQIGERKMSSEVYKKYLSNLLTPQDIKQNLYPDIRLPLYKKYHTIVPRESLIDGTDFNSKIQIDIENEKYFNNKNLILVIDCEMVTTGMGFQLARCTIVNYQQQVIFDQFFKPSNQILNYNTAFSGITKQILDPVTNTIQTILHPFLNKCIKKDTILIGHSLENDFNAMQFYHPKIVDTSVLFRRKNGTKMKLKNLADKILNRKIQSITHDSKQDCLATLHLVQAKIQNEKLFQSQKQYHLLRDLINNKHGILIVDSDIDNMKMYNSIHLQKVEAKESPQKICDIIRKYSNKNQVAVPKIVFTKFQKSELKDWENYYQQIDSSLEKLYKAVPQGTVFFINFQINQVVRIVPFTKQQEKRIRTRPFLVVIPKN